MGGVVQLTQDQVRSLQETGTDLRGLAAELASDSRVVLAYLFGSVASGRADSLSDVDVAVLFDCDCTGQQRLAGQLDLMHQLSQFTEREVEVISLNDADPILAHEVVSQGVLLFARNEEAFVSFSSRAYRLYFDFKPIVDSYVLSFSQDLHTGGILGRGRRGEEAVAALRELHQRARAATPGDS